LSTDWLKVEEMTQEKELQGKVVLVTGGGGGIGAVFGRELAASGASVALADLAGDRATDAAQVILDRGGKAMGVTLDVTNPESAEAAVEAVMTEFGGLDILINSAALMAEIPITSLDALPFTWWERVLAVNVGGAFTCTKACIPEMERRGGGRIVNLASAGAFMPAGVYGISKAALVSLTLNFAAELGHRGITVNALAPGLVKDEAGYRAAPDDGIREMLRQRIPLKTHIEGTPEDLFGALLLLVSERGAWITGQTIGVDGGWAMRF
jgi:NAD(P)-dependent dehydrogenase (short-subunit alcohol dehydrogenase family)